MSNVKAVYGSVQDVGKLVKKTKKHFVWKFTIRGRDHIIELFVSFVSGKKKIRVDGKVVYDSQKVMASNFTYQLEIEDNTFEINQYGNYAEKFELIVNGQRFENLYSGLNGYDDVSGPQHSYNYSQPRGDDRYNRKDTFRNNYDDNGEMGHWGDVRKAASHTKPRRDYYDDDRQGGNRDNSFEDDNQGYRGQQRNNYEDDQETKYSMRHHGKAKTYGPDGDFDNMPRPSNRRVESQKTTSFDDFDKFSNFGNFENKENRAPNVNSSTMRTQNQPQNNIMDTRAQVKPSFFQAETQNGRQEVPLTTSQVVTQNDFFAYGTQEVSQAPSQQVQPTTTTTTTLIDFATPSSTNVSLINDLYKNAPAPQVTTVDLLGQTQSQPQGQSQFNALPPSENMKKDLWQTDLVSLNSNEVDNKNNLMRTHSYNVQPQNYNNFNTSMNNMYNNQNQMGMNNNMNMMNSNMNMGMNMNMGGFNGNMGMNQNNFGRMHSTLY